MYIKTLNAPSGLNGIISDEEYEALPNDLQDFYVREYEESNLEDKDEWADDDYDDDYEEYGNEFELPFNDEFDK